MTSSGVCIVTPAERDGQDIRGQMDFYAVCGTDKITIYSEEENLSVEKDVYYIATDGEIPTAAISDGAVEVDKIEGLADGEVIIGVDGTAANNTKVTISGDVVIANDGTATIQSNAVETAMIDDNAVTAAKTDFVVSAFLGAPAVADTETYLADTTIINGTVAAADYALASAVPDMPRNITITVTDGDTSISAGTIVVTGEDLNGNTISETLDLSSALTLTGTKIFAEVTNIEVSGLVGNGGTDNIKVGTGDVIGLPSDIQATSAVRKVFFDGAIETSPTLSAGDNLSGVDVSASTYDATKLLYVMYNVGE